MTRRAYPEPLIARVRAALRAGISHKTIATYSGLNLRAVELISCGKTQPDVRSDPELFALLTQWLSANNASTSTGESADNHAQGSAREEMEACAKTISP
jgi:hypothetical protein